MSETVREMTACATPHIRPAAVLHHVGHRRTLVGEPVFDTEEVAHLARGEGLIASGYMLRLTVVLLPRSIAVLCRIRPIRRHDIGGAKCDCWNHSKSRTQDQLLHYSSSNCSRLRALCPKPLQSREQCSGGQSTGTLMNGFATRPECDNQAS